MIAILLSGLGCVGGWLHAQEPPVPGFGAEAELPPVLGFGVADDFFSAPVSERDQRTVDETFRRYDSNRDGFLSRDELARNRWRDDPLIYDRNQDGRVSKDEMAIRYARRRLEEETERLMKFYVELDKNGDKILEPREFADSRFRSSIEDKIRETGMDPTRPIPLSLFMSKRLGNAGVESKRISNVVKTLGSPLGVGIPSVSNRRDSDYSRARPTADRSQEPSEDEGRSYRFRSAQERLPSDTPDWFLERDENGDGQVAMAEYASSWTNALVAEFLRYDANEDGFITAQECIDGLTDDGGD